MKLKLSIGLILSTLVAQPAFSAVSITLSDSVPAVAKLYDPNTTQTIAYILKSDAPFAIPFTVSGISSPLSVTNDCNSTLPAAPKQCKISVTIAPTADLAGKKINQTLTINQRTKVQLVKPISFTVSDLTKPSTLVAGGELSNAPGLLVVSNDNGATWAIKNAADGFPGNTGASFFDAVNCYGTGSSVVCLALGSSTEPSKRIAVSVDNGNNWAYQVNESGGQLYSASCTEDNQCVAVGYKKNDAIKETIAALLINTDASHSVQWETPNVMNETPRGQLNTISCTGSGEQTVCVTAGKGMRYDHGWYSDGVILLKNTPNKLKTWYRIDTSEFWAATHVDQVSCTGSGRSAICLAKAYKYWGQNVPEENNGYYLIMSDNSGDFWQTTQKIENTAGGISCTGSRSSAMCAAANNKSLYVTRNGGSLWQDELVTGAIAPGLVNVSCTTNNAATFCATVGTDTNSNNPLVAITHSGDTAWASKPIVGAPSNGYLTSVQCHYTGNTSVVCLAGGYNFSDSAPLLVVSSDGAGEVWKTVELPSIKGIDGEIYSVSGQGTVGAASAKKFGLKNGVIKSLPTA